MSMTTNYVIETGWEDEEFDPDWHSPRREENE